MIRTAEEPYRSRIDQQIILWKFARLDIRAQFNRLVVAQRMKDFDMGRLKEEDRRHTITLAQEIIANSSEAERILVFAPTGLLYLLRWFWWRINAWCEVVAMVSSFGISVFWVILKKWGSAESQLSTHERLRFDLCNQQALGWSGTFRSERIQMITCYPLRTRNSNGSYTGLGKLIDATVRFAAYTKSEKVYNALFAAQSPNGRHIRYYTPSEATVDLDGGVSLKVRQETDYPTSGRVLIHLDPSQPTNFPLRLRIPRWCKKVSISVNGQSWKKPMVRC